MAMKYVVVEFFSSFSPLCNRTVVCLLACLKTAIENRVYSAPSLAPLLPRKNRSDKA